MRTTTTQPEMMRITPTFSNFHYKKLTEEEVKNMVANIEEKSERVRDDIADMAMSEQYLRTKQALLKAKKKEQEMQIAQRMASLREEEVIKMREKVAKMQVLFVF